MMEPLLVREKTELVALCSLPGISNRQINELLLLFGSPAGAWEAVTGGLTTTGTLERKKIEIQAWAQKNDPHQFVGLMEEQGIKAIARGEHGYPELLKEIHDPPFVLFYRGELPPSEALPLAIVGSRKGSPYGLGVAKWLAIELVREGLTVVSGAAYGIDTEAHKGALAGGGNTVAVLGCGPNVLYPRSNRNLFREIELKGCLLSEYPPNSLPLKHHFPARNRIIAGMSLGVVVVEASSSSGALITAGCALSEDREVFAVPGQIFSSNSNGTNALIRNGAIPVTSAEDVLQELRIERSKTNECSRADHNCTRPFEEAMLDALCLGISDVERLSGHLGISTAETLSGLARMEVSGLARRGPGGRYYPASRSVRK